MTTNKKARWEVPEWMKPHLPALGLTQAVAEYAMNCTGENCDPAIDVGSFLICGKAQAAVDILEQLNAAGSLVKLAKA